MERICLEEDDLQIQLAEQLPGNLPLVVKCNGVSGLAVACSQQTSAKQFVIPKAAKSSVTWAINAEPAPVLGSIETLRILPAQTN